jgi:2-keto-4-pentenoate hydratase/2-oxohepta-3-ene-1,7-dioic acid hydratase in catechol pathway
MRLASFSVGGWQSYGAITGDGVLDLGLHFGRRTLSLRTCLQSVPLAELDDLIRRTPPDWRLDQIQFEPVIPDPGKIICVGLNYREHVRESGHEVTPYPVLFARYADSQIGHGQPMLAPQVSTQFDYEGELAVVIGKPGRNIEPEHALSHVAGYSCYNDGSVRDWQMHTSQYLAGKNFVATGAFGPWLVTADEIPDPAGLTLETRLNGMVMQHATTGMLITPIPELIAYCSTILPLRTGDVLVTGTPGGVGVRRTPPVWMAAGDTVEVEISRIGCLRNPIADAEPFAEVAGNACAPVRVADR